MAANDEDLVSQIQITGGDESSAQLELFANKGAAAFDKLNKSATQASKGVASATDNINASTKKASTGLDQLGNAGASASNVPGKIKDIENAVSSLTSKFPQLTQAVGRFTQRLALVGAAAVASATGLASVARSVAKQVDGTSDSLDKQTNAQIDANNASLQQTTGLINLDSAQRKLTQQLGTGALSYQDYNKQVKALNDDYREQQRVARDVAFAQAQVKDENDRLAKSLKDRTAYQALIDTFGGPLLSSLTSFGRQIESIRQQMLTAFGPAAASVIDSISTTLSKNATAIGKFFDDASKKMDTLLRANGPQIQKLLENLGGAAASVFNGLIDAAPALIDFFNNTLVPTIQKVSGWFTSLADGINKVFGTKLTGGSVFLIVLLAQMTGSVRLLFTLVRAGGSIFKGFIGVLETIGLAIAEAFGAKKVAGIVKVASAATKSGGVFKTFLAVIRTAIPLFTLLAETVATALGIGFGPAVIVVTALAAALIYLVTQVDWKAFGAAAVKVAQDLTAKWQGVLDWFKAFPANLNIIWTVLWDGAKNLASEAATWVTTAWQAVLDWFTSFPTNVNIVFTVLWNAIKTMATDAATWTQAKWQAFIAWIAALPTTVGAFFTTLWTAVQGLATTAAQWVIDKWNAVVSFFAGIPASVGQIFTDLWESVKQITADAFTALTDTVKGWVDSVLGWLKPILDGIAKVNSAVSSGNSGAGGGGSVTAATGGHIRGPGTGTSDSIAAWLSNNEYVVKAKSVAKYGVGFMNAINSGRFKMPRFSTGGLNLISPTPRTHYADGGPVQTGGGMRPLSLSLFGETFDGLMMPDNVADRMAKFAIGRQTRSAGRRPSWVGGTR